MININEKPTEGTWPDPEIIQKDVWDEDDEHIARVEGLSLEDQEKNLELHKYVALRERLNNKLLSLDLLEVPADDEIGQRTVAALKREIAELDEKIAALGGGTEIES